MKTQWQTSRIFITMFLLVTFILASSLVWNSDMLQTAAHTTVALRQAAHEAIHESAYATSERLENGLRSAIPNAMNESSNTLDSISVGIASRLENEPLFQIVAILINGRRILESANYAEPNETT